MATMIETSEELKPQLDAAQAEVQRLEEQATSAKPAELGKIATALAAARALFDLLVKRYNAAVGRQQAEKAAQEAAERERLHQEAVEALRNRKASCDAAWEQWGADAETLETSLEQLWDRYIALQREGRAIHEENARLDAKVPPVMGSVSSSAFVQRCIDGRGHRMLNYPESVRRAL